MIAWGIIASSGACCRAPFHFVGRIVDQLYTTTRPTTRPTTCLPVGKARPTIRIMKIALYNIEYCTGINGSIKQYLFKFWRYFWSSNVVLKKICRFLKKLKADVVLLIEVDGGSLRNGFRSQAEEISKKTSLPFYYSKCKYHPKSWLSKLPFLSSNHNSIFSKNEGEIKTHYLKTGTKRLVQEYIVNEVSIFMVHLSLSKKERSKQFTELGRMLKKCTNPYMVCGDFNVFGGMEEVVGFAEKNNLRISETNATFPSVDPIKRLDLIMAHEDIKIKSVEVGDIQYSDHLPVVVEIG